MNRQLFTTIAAACVAAMMVAAGCGGQVEPAIRDKPPVEGGTITILVDNTSVSLPVIQLKSDRDRFMEAIHSFINSVLEGKSR